ncbi:related to ketoreductase [Cephalotrichum gorgonifer]|uniref:Related to ketoreductase n=1 Tax=Cephalotrichum gorgonifer TaxID=2041049 RepID=A0AAE8N0R7_9PEZI|nr:related to ketoreductase [Cephalotrichum gorgonifer]
MASTTNVLISGASRGLGKAFVEQYLARPSHTVIGTVRDVKSAAAEELRALPAAKGSKVVLVKVEYTSTTDAVDAVKELEAHGITKLDVVIANAGIAGQQGRIETIDPKGLAEVYLVNAVGPAVLFLALKPLLDRAETPKWLAISSGLASLHDLHKYPMFPGFPYNGSKAALNHFTKTIHVESPKIIAFAVSPGFFETDMGRKSAAFFDLTNPPFSDINTNIKSIIGLVDNATRENYSGQFLNFDGQLIEW